jgi:hypothetical protein
MVLFLVSLRDTECVDFLVTRLKVWNAGVRQILINIGESEVRTVIDVLHRCS